MCKSWQEQYYNAVFDHSNSNNIKLMIKLAEEHLNREMSLFKYRSGSRNDILNIINDKLVACNPKMFNDPFDCEYESIEIARELYKKEKGETKEENFNYWYNNEYKVRHGILKEFNLCSLSAEKDNILLWSHYANNHQGFCIEYDYKEVARKHQLTLPILYCDEMPKLNNGEGFFVKHLYTKANDWSYENEWRILYNSCNKELTMIDMPKPKALYLGCNSDKPLEEFFRKYCKSNNVGLWKMEKHKSEYKLIPGIIDLY